MRQNCGTYGLGQNDPGENRPGAFYRQEAGSLCQTEIPWYLLDADVVSGGEPDAYRSSLSLITVQEEACSTESGTESFLLKLSGFQPRQTVCRQADQSRGQGK